MRYPISIQTFEKIIDGGYVYVDKTDLVYELAQENVCFLSRPRRFGKSLLISTLEAYFLGRKELFKGLKMEALENDWNVHPVFRIDFASGDFSDPHTLPYKLEAYLSDWEKLYGADPARKETGDRFQYVLEQAYRQTGKKAVVLVDEYDRPMLDVLGEPQEEINRNTLRGFYGTFKAADASLRFVLLTGVTKFSQITVFSGFNQPNDISMQRKFDAICGITEEELHTVFAEPIREMAASLNYTEEQMKAVLKKHYDGYHFSSRMLDIYNPFSIINALNCMEIDNYWYRSATPTYLIKLLEGSRVNVQKLTERRYLAQEFVDYRACREDPLAMLYQSGYLTIRGYEPRAGLYTLDFPNREVRQGFIVLTAGSCFHRSESDMTNWAADMADALRDGDLNRVRDMYTSFLASIPYEANKDERAKDFESHYQYAFYLMNRMLGSYSTLIEKQNSKGRADVIVETDSDIYIFEFKLDGSADEALRQIEQQQYALPYLSDPRRLHKIGVNISSGTRTVAEWKAV